MRRYRVEDPAELRLGHGEDRRELADGARRVGLVEGRAGEEHVRKHELLLRRLLLVALAFHLLVGTIAPNFADAKESNLQTNDRNKRILVEMIENVI